MGFCPMHVRDAWGVGESLFMTERRASVERWPVA